MSYFTRQQQSAVSGQYLVTNSLYPKHYMSAPRETKGGI